MHVDWILPVNKNHYIRNKCKEEYVDIIQNNVHIYILKNK